METTIYLMRHAQTLPSPAQENDGWRLSAKGLEQASAVVPFLKEIGVEAAYSSPLERATQTLSIFNTATGIDVQPHEGLTEHEIAKRYLPPAEFQSETKAYWDDLDYAHADCESARDCQERMLKALEEMAEKHAGGKVLACSHLQPIALVLRHFDDKFTFEDWANVRMPEIFKLIYTGNQGTWDRTFTSPDF